MFKPPTQSDEQGTESGGKVNDGKNNEMSGCAGSLGGQMCVKKRTWNLIWIRWENKESKHIVELKHDYVFSLAI